MALQTRFRGNRCYATVEELLENRQRLCVLCGPPQGYVTRAQGLWWWAARGLAPRRTDWRETARHKVTLTLFNSAAPVELWDGQSSVNTRQWWSDAARSWGHEPVGTWTQKQRNLRRWQPLPSNDSWRHSRLRRLSACHSEVQSVWIIDSAIITCSYQLYVFSKSNYQSKPRH
jgi:hypothetical protein